MNGTFSDGFPKDPYQAVDFSYFLSDQEKQEWREWIPNANQASQQELVETLHEIWKENQKSAIPDGFDNNLGGNQPAPTNQNNTGSPFPNTPNTPNNNYNQSNQQFGSQLGQPSYNQPSFPPSFNQPPSNPSDPSNPANSPFIDPFDPFGGPLNTPNSFPQPNSFTPPTTPPPYIPPQTPQTPQSPQTSQPNPASIPNDPFPPISKPTPFVQPAPTAINVPPFTPTPLEDKPANNLVNEFYFPAQNGADQKTTITPPAPKPAPVAPVQIKVPESPKPINSNSTQPNNQTATKVVPISDTSKENIAPEPKKTTTQEADLDKKPVQNSSSNPTPVSSSNITPDNADRQVMKNQLALLEKLTRSFGRMEKSLEEIKNYQIKQDNSKEASTNIEQTTQKIQKDTGSLSSMVNTLYDEMAILRTMVQNQQDQIRTLNAHIQQFYTQQDRKLPIPHANEVSEVAGTINSATNPPVNPQNKVQNGTYQNANSLSSTNPFNRQ